MSALATPLIELGALFLVLSVLASISWRVGLTAAPLFLLAGLFLGDGGIIGIDASEPFLSVAAELGMVLLLLTLGLEFSAAEFTQSLRRNAPSGLVDFVLNAPPGFVAGKLMGLDFGGCLVMAGVTWISSSGVVARLLSDLGRMGFRETPAVLSVLVLEDVAMAGFLPLVGVAVAGGALAAGVAGAGVALLLTIVVIFLARKSETLAERMLSHDDDELVLLRILGVTVLVGGLAQWAGISAAVGAFLVGLAIPPATGERIRGLLRPLRDVFAAVFFLTFGLGVSPEVLPGALGGAVLLLIVTTLTKIATGWFAAAREGAGVRGRVRAGTALVARGEFSIVMAGMAVAAGYSEIGPMASAYVVLTAIVGPVLSRFADGLSRIFPGGRAKARVPETSAAPIQT